jgi:hypothetical protein
LPALPDSVKRVSATCSATPHFAALADAGTVRIPFDASRVAANEQLVLLKAAPDPR